MLQSGSLTSHQPPQLPPAHSEIWQWSSSHSLAPLTSSHSALAPAYRRSSAPHAPPPHSGIMCFIFQSFTVLRLMTLDQWLMTERSSTHHASARRAASSRKPQVLSSSSPTLHPVTPLLLTSSLRSFLAAWTPPAGSLDPHSLPPSAECLAQFRFFQNKTLFALNNETPQPEQTRIHQAK